MVSGNSYRMDRDYHRRRRGKPGQRVGLATCGDRGACSRQRPVAGGARSRPSEESTGSGVGPLAGGLALEGDDAAGDVHELLIMVAAGALEPPVGLLLA